MTTCSSGQGTTMGTCKAKSLQADFGILTHSSIFWHVQTYSSIMRHIQELLRHIQVNSGPCVNLVYSQLWHIENQRPIQKPVMFRILVYSELLHSENQGHIQKPGIFRTLGYWEPRYIQNPGVLKTWSIFRTLSNIYNEVFCENT